MQEYTLLIYVFPSHNKMLRTNAKTHYKDIEDHFHNVTLSKVMIWLAHKVYTKHSKQRIYNFREI